MRTPVTFADTFEIEADRSGWFAHKVDGAKLQCTKSRVVSRMRRRGAEHHHRPRRFAHDVAQRLKAVELRHVDVHRHELRIERMNLLQRVDTVPRRAGDTKFARALENLRDQAAHKSAVVDDEDRARAARCAAA
jgi:hypothetical protein